MNQVPVCADVSPQLVARAHFLVGRSLSEREYAQPQFEQLLYIERDYRTMCHFEDLLRSKVVVCTAYLYDWRVGVHNRDIISFHSNVDGGTSALVDGHSNRGAILANVMSTVGTSLVLPRCTLDHAPLVPFVVDVSSGSPLV